MPSSILPPQALLSEMGPRKGSWYLTGSLGPPPEPPAPTGLGSGSAHGERRQPPCAHTRTLSWEGWTLAGGVGPDSAAQGQLGGDLPALSQSGPHVCALSESCDPKHAPSHLAPFLSLSRECRPLSNPPRPCDRAQSPGDSARLSPVPCAWPLAVTESLFQLHINSRF